MDLHLTTTRHALTRALAVAKVGASVDATLPILNALNIGVSSRGTLLVQGTDRYLAVRAHLAPEGSFTSTDALNEGGITFRLPTAGLIQKWLTIVDKAAPVTVTWSPEFGLTLAADEAPTLTGIMPVKGNYPKLDQLIRPGEEVDPGIHDRAGSVLLATRNLAKLGTVAGYYRRHHPVLLRPGTKAPTNDLVFRISDGDTVMADGIIMGVGHPENPVLHQHGL
jgi:hypothetical protein